VNAARLTSGSGSSSWPTISVNESKNSVGKSQEHRNSIPLGTMAVMQDAANWPTPNTEDSKGAGSKATRENGKQMQLHHAVRYGQAAPASSSSLGSRQGLWLTPRANEPDSTRTPNGNPKKDGIPLGMQAKQWATPAARDTQGQRGAAANARKGNPLDTLPNQMAQWGTPTARDHKSGRGNEDRQYKELTPMVERQHSGKLNPRWVETLMGLPIGWTMPSCTSPQTIAPMSCDFSAMELCLPPQSEPSEFSLASCGNWTTPNQMDASIAKPALRPSRIATGRKTDYLARQVSMIQAP
jgi:hypothetical protein